MSAPLASFQLSVVLSSFVTAVELVMFAAAVMDDDQDKTPFRGAQKLNQHQRDEEQGDVA